MLKPITLPQITSNEIIHGSIYPPLYHSSSDGIFFIFLSIKLTKKRHGSKCKVFYPQIIFDPTPIWLGLMWLCHSEFSFDTEKNFFDEYKNIYFFLRLVSKIQIEPLSSSGSGSVLVLNPYLNYTDPQRCSWLALDTITKLDLIRQKHDMKSKIITYISSIKNKT